MNCTITIDIHGLRANALGLSDIGPCLPRWWWRTCGTSAWQEAAPTTLQLQADGGWRAEVGPLNLTLRVEQDGRGDWRLISTLCNSSDQTMELARVHVLDGPVAANPGFIAVNGVHGGNWLHAPFIADPGTHPPILDLIREQMKEGGWLLSWLDDPVHRSPGWAASTDCGVITQGWGEPGWVLGTTGSGTAFGEAALHRDGDGKRRMALGQRLDGIRFAAGATRHLDGHWLGAGDWQEGLERLADAVGEEMAPRPTRPPLLGWCSWYRHGPLMSAGVVTQAIEHFRSWDAAPNQRLIQLDDGWQVMPGEWRPNQRFAATWNGLPQRIADSGALPGIWVAPTLLGAEHPLLRAHPEVIQRRTDGSPAHHSPGWGWCGHEADWTWGAGPKAHHLEPEHPLVIALMRRSLTQLRNEGWRYFKLDFVWDVCTDRRAWNPERTSFEVIREVYRLCREILGDDALINACTGVPMRCVIGHADLCRIGDDLGPNWNHAATCLRQMALRAAPGGRWFQADPDVFYMRSSDTALNPEESRFISRCIGILGGTFLTSEHPGEWNPEETRLVRSFWPPEPVTAIRAIWSTVGDVQALLSRRRDGSLAVLLLNWSEGAATVTVGPADHPWLHSTLSAHLARHDSHLVIQPASVLVGV